MFDASTLQATITELKAQLGQRDARIYALTAEVLRLRRWRFGRSSESIDPTIAPELPLSGGQQSDVSVVATTSAADKTERLPRLASVDTPAATRRPARTLPAELPRVTHRHTPATCDCPQCGGHMRTLGEDVSEQLDYVPGYFQVIRHVRPRLACIACTRIVQAAAPSRPIERGLPTAGLLAQVISAKYADHCPLYRQSGIYRRSGLELPRTLLASWIRETAQLLDPLVQSLERYVMGASKLHADDTPVPVLEPGKGRTRTARLWAYVRDDRPAAGPDPPAVLYRYSPDRRGEHPQSHLRAFTGTLQADGYGGFAALYRDGRVHEAACWAHARRKFFDVYAADRSPTAAEALRRIGTLYDIERKIRGRTPAERAAHRQAHAVPVVSELYAWMNQLLRTVSVKSPLGAALQYSLARWQALGRYLTDGRIEIDNNAAERAIRALVLGRRNYLFAGSDGGGENAARLYSLIGTCRLNNIDPYHYLRTVLERIAEHPINRIEHLLPWRLDLEVPAARAA